MKTAGTSTEALLEQYCLPPGTECGTHDRVQTVSDYGIAGSRYKGYKKTDVFYNHMPAKELKQKLKPEVWDQYFKFTSVRNPWDRMVSLFWNYYHPRAEELLSKPFSYIQHWFYKFARGKHSITNYMIEDHSIFSIDEKLIVDDVVRYESLHDDLARICKHLDIDYRKEELPRWKTDWRKLPTNYQDYYIDQKVIDNVALGHKFEIDHFGYTF